MKTLSFILKNWKLILIIILAITSTIAFFAYRGAQKDVIRLKGDVISLNNNYRDKSGKYVTEVSELNLTKKELELKIKNGDSVISKLKKDVSDMGIKLKNIQSMGSISHVIHDTIKVPYFIFADNSKKFNYCDGYMDLTMISDSLESRIEYTYTDYMTWAVSRYHLDKWRLINLFKPRPWYYKLSAKFDNPKAKINFSEFVTIKK